MFTITDHAVERYVERIAPGTTLASARARLEEYAHGAARLRLRTRAGDCLYQSEELECRLVVRPSQQGERGGVVVTVVPKDDADAVVEPIVEESSFDLTMKMRALVAANASQRPAILSLLSREEIMQVKAETLLRMQDAADRKQKDIIANLNGLGMCVNLELKKRFPVPSCTDQLFTDLRRVLADMLYKYGWNGNEAAYEVYQRAKGEKIVR